MKKAYTNLEVKFEYIADIVSTSAEVETGRIPFISFGDTPDSGQGVMDSLRKMAFNR